MKHSRYISLVLIATLATTSLTACAGSDDRPLPNLEGKKIFSSVEECKKSGEKNCDNLYQLALKSHLINGQRYADKGKCEVEHVDCTSIALAGASVWLPMMVGFMANNRPVYLQKPAYTTVEVEDEDGNIYDRELTADEKKERHVVAGPSAYDNNAGRYNVSSPIIVGGWYPTTSYYRTGLSRSGLSVGMGASAVRSGGSSGASFGSSSRGGVARATVSSRGGFGASGRGFSGGS